VNAVEGHNGSAKEPRSTRTDFRLTRAPVDTPRGRLHRLAALVNRGARQAVRLARQLEPAELGKMRAVAQQAARQAAQHLSGTRHAQFATFLYQRLYDGLDQALGALELYLQLEVPSICEELTKTLVLLEAAETRSAELEIMLGSATRDLAFERGQNQQLRTSLAAQQVRLAVTEQDIPSETFEEPTRNRELTDHERRVISDPDAQPGDLERYLREENDELRRTRDEHARTIHNLRVESRALYASYVALIGRLRAHESVEGAETQRAHFREALARLGAVDAR